MVNGVRVIRARRIPIDDASKVNPAAGKEHAAGNRPRVESRDIGIAALGICAYAQRQVHERKTVIGDVLVGRELLHLF